MSLSERQYGDAAGLEGAQQAAKPAPSYPDLLQKALPLRLTFIGACGLAAATAVWFAGKGVQSADPDLAKLLRRMAIIKTVILLAAAICGDWVRPCGLPWRRATFFSARSE